MAMPDRPSTIDLEDEPPDSKRSRKVPPTAKARPAGSVADSWGPKPPAEAPPPPPANKHKDKQDQDGDD